MSRIIVIGNLGRDPEVRYAPTGQMVASFSMASNHIYKDNLGLKHTDTQWFQCLAYGKLAEVCNTHLTKGQLSVYHAARQQQPPL
jgi:single-strand DNA-binding protein